MDTPANSQPLQSISLSSRRRQALRQQTLSECFSTSPSSSQTDDARSGKRRKILSSDPFSDDTEITVPTVERPKGKARTAKWNLATQLEALALGPSHSPGYSCRTYLETLVSDPVDDVAASFRADPVYSLVNSNALKRGERGFTAIACASGHLSLLQHSAVADPKPCLETICASSRRVGAHANAIFGVAVSASDRTIATGSGDFACQVIDSETLRPRANLYGHTGSPRSVTFAPESDNIVITGARDGSICIWDLRVDSGHGLTRSTTWIRNAHDDLFAHRRGPRPAGASKPSIAGAAILPHNDHLLISAASGDATVKVWDLRATAQFRKVHPVAIEQSAASPNEEQGRGRGVCRMVVSPEGDRAYTLGMDGVIRSHDPNYLCRPAGVLPSWTHPCFTPSTFYVPLALSPCSRFLAAGTSIGNIVLVDTQSPRHDNLGGTVCIRATKAEDEICALDWTSDGLLSAADGDGELRRWSFDRSTPASKHSHHSQPS